MANQVEQELAQEEEDPWGDGFCGFVDPEALVAPPLQPSSTTRRIEAPDLLPDTQDKVTHEEFRKIAAETADRFPNYGWDNPGTDTHTIELDINEGELPALRPIRGIQYADREGNPCVARLSQAVVDPLLRWFSGLKWTDRADTISPLTSRRAARISFTELVIDYFLATGVLPCGPTHPLSVQAAAFAKVIRQLITSYKLVMGGKRYGIQAAFKPDKVNSMQPLISRSAADGLQRRPIFDAARVARIAAHILLADSADRARFGNIESGHLPVGSAYLLRRFGVAPVAQTDHVALVIDSINDCLAGESLRNRTAKAKLVGPCKFGHKSTARYLGRADNWHRAVDVPADDAVSPGDILCHACYLAMRARARQQFGVITIPPVAVEQPISPGFAVQFVSPAHCQSSSSSRGV